MTPSMQRLLESWNGLGVVCSYHRATSAWIFIALHDDTLGTPVGGTRMKVYERLEDGLPRYPGDTQELWTDLAGNEQGTSEQG